MYDGFPKFHDVAKGIFLGQHHSFLWQLSCQRPAVRNVPISSLAALTSIDHKWIVGNYPKKNRKQSTMIRMIRNGRFDSSWTQWRDVWEFSRSPCGENSWMCRLLFFGDFVLSRLVTQWLSEALSCPLIGLCSFPVASPLNNYLDYPDNCHASIQTNRVLVEWRKIPGIVRLGIVDWSYGSVTVDLSDKTLILNARYARSVLVETKDFSLDNSIRMLILSWKNFLAKYNNIKKYIIQSECFRYLQACYPSKRLRHKITTYAKKMKKRKRRSSPCPLRHLR
jgi:hypothetical protein